jgi:molybdopterin converting factor small subunit
LLRDIEDKTKAGQKNLASLKQQCASAQKQLAKTLSAVAKERGPLEAYSRAQELGFGEIELVRLAKASKTLGGPKAVLAAFGAHADCSEITQQREKALRDVATLQATIGKLESQYGHLKTAVELCNRLITEYKFGFDAIATIFSVAQKFGEPTSVLKVIEGFGSLQSLAQMEQQLDGRVKEKQGLLEQLNGRVKEDLDMVDHLIGKCLALSTEVGKIEGALANSKELQAVSKLLNDPASATFVECSPAAIAVAAGLLKFAEIHQKQLPNFYYTQSGLKSFVRDLGGN